MELANKGSGARPLLSERHFVQHPVGSQHKDDHLLGVGLDAETRHQLEHGKALTEMLKQPLYQPKSDAEQVVILTLASHGMLDTLPLAEQRAKVNAFVRSFHADVSGAMDAIASTGKITPEQVDAILTAWKTYAGGESHAVQ